MPVIAHLTARLRPMFIAACLIAGGGGFAPVAQAQVYTPYLPSIDDQQLERDADLLLDEVQRLVQLFPEQRNLAILRAKLATQLAPRNPDSWAVLGGLYLLDNQAAASLGPLEKAKVLAPKEPVIWFRLGNAYFQTKEYAKAIAALQMGLKLKPNIQSAMFDLGNAYLLSGKTNEAIAIYQTSYEQDKTFWFPLNNIGLIRYKQGNIDEAIKLWQACIAIDAREAEPKLALAAALFRRKADQTQAVRLAAEAMNLNLRYSEPQYMRDNLWSEELIADTVKVLAHPTVQAAIVKAQAAQVNSRSFSDQ